MNQLLDQETEHCQLAFGASFQWVIPSPKNNQYPDF